MDLMLLYKEVESRIAQVDFSALWKGFRPLKFALYTNDTCCFDGHFIEKTAAFCANTAILYEGEHIAVWNVAEQPEDMDVLAASIIHEMFHAFQMDSGESRFPDEKEAPFKYRYEIGSLSAKLGEAEAIRAALQGDESAYHRLCGLRKARAAGFPYEYAYEAGVEQIEGSANFVELAALSQLDPLKGEKAWQRLLDRIKKPEHYFPIRIVSYEIGAAVIACIKKHHALDVEQFTGQPFACAMLSGSGAEEITVPDNAEVKACLDGYLAETHSIIAAALEKNDCVLRGSYPLGSVNIYNARCEGRYIVSNYFIMYRDGSADQVLYGDFVAELDEQYNILAVYRQSSEN